MGVHLESSSTGDQLMGQGGLVLLDGGVVVLSEMKGTISSDVVYTFNRRDQALPPSLRRSKEEREREMSEDGD